MFLYNYFWRLVKPIIVEFSFKKTYKHKYTFSIINPFFKQVGQYRADFVVSILNGGLADPK